MSGRVKTLVVAGTLLATGLGFAAGLLVARSTPDDALETCDAALKYQALIEDGDVREWVASNWPTPTFGGDRFEQRRPLLEQAADAFSEAALNLTSLRLDLLRADHEDPTGIEAVIRLTEAHALYFGDLNTLYLAHNWRQETPPGDPNLSAATRDATSRLDYLLVTAVMSECGLDDWGL